MLQLKLTFTKAAVDWKQGELWGGWVGLQCHVETLNLNVHTLIIGMWGGRCFPFTGVERWKESSLGMPEE